MADNRIDTVEKVLSDAIALQAADSPENLDLRVIATEIVAALGRPVAANPIDPEGDGLESDEINAANDL
ncbi:hypothetical protein [Devosia sp.]|uniref:hypothetical protein n=1 Tax=Devosia sp. TaxID=1871048 RepID=UPI003A8F5CBB